jgi:hypothetical protein
VWQNVDIHLKNNKATPMQKRATENRVISLAENFRFDKNASFAFD